MSVVGYSSWARMTWPEVGDAIPSSSRAAILPLGATEQHGPLLSTGMDSVLAEALCRYVSSELVRGMAAIPSAYRPMGNRKLC